MFRIFLLALFVAWHPVHVSVMSVEYSVEDEAFIGFLKVYYDDFMVDLADTGGVSAAESLKVQSEEAKEILGSYLNKRLSLYAGENRLNPEIKKIGLNDNELKLDLVYKMKKRSKIIRIYNSILTDVYPDQSNLVMLRYGKFEEGVKLTSEKREHNFKVK